MTILLISTFSCSDGSEIVVTPRMTTPVSREIALVARQMTVGYLSDKTWGFFGAMCDQWLDIDYTWLPDQAERLEDGRVTAIFQRREERILGPETLTFKVDFDTGAVKGENEIESERLGVTEGCDAW